ncbi:RecX family transcriptional regulator [Sphingomonas morindae]|uniref:RecX family transcriptional regulator n=1 Tax=Sphingomonas morindae TaxID=1541170 RepID=A0ABY4XC26_9SPHN|nr:RecX family transcriptional regulator [Sphingomonas morindae]USI74445.1 RecX family transcriptional regulator [Sphingomonas morindae]
MTAFRPKKAPEPLTAATLERLALAYVGRYATSRVKLERYLARKIAERGWEGATPPDPHALAARLAGLGYVDDAALAAARGRALARRGLGARRLGVALDGLGIAGEDRAEALEEARRHAWETALRYAERRRLGPFAPGPVDPAARRRGVAAMLRAGHAPDHVRAIMESHPGTVPQRDEN